MAGTLRIYDPTNWVTKTPADIALGLPNRVQGITFDGAYFWIVDTAGILYQGHIDKTGAVFDIDKSVDVSPQLSNFSRLSAITTDGLNLYIAYQTLVTTGGFPPLSIVGAKVAQFDKFGNSLKELTAFAVANSVTYVDNEYQDLTFNGIHVISSHGETSPGGVFKGVDPFNDTLAWTTNFGTAVGAMKRAIAFNGNSFYVVRNGTSRALAEIDYDQTVLDAGLNVGAVDVQGCCFGSKDFRLWPTGELHNEIDGEWLAVVFN